MLFLATTGSMAERSKTTKKTQVKPARKSTAPAPLSNDYLKFLMPVIGITFLLFIPVLRNAFTNWDDTLYVTDNPLLKDLSLKGIKAIFSTPVVSNYHPLTIMTLAVNYQLAELNPWSYHLTSILLHVANTSFVFWFVMLLSRNNKWVSAFSALLFGIHPMHVESVVWISERKDLLYTLFYLLAMIVYVRYLRDKKFKFLIAVYVLGILSLLSKPAAIVLPFSLILLDYFLKRKWSYSWIVEKLPLFIMSAIMAYITVNIQSERAIASVEMHGLTERICFAGYGLIWYLVKFVFPYPLSALHPFPDQLSWYHYAATLASVAGIILLIFKVRDRNYRFAFGFYIINLILVLQLVSIGNAVVAERYTYVPYISLFYLLGLELYGVIDKHSKARFPAYIIAGIWLIGLSYITFSRIPVWKTSETLWTDVLQHYPESPRAWTNKGLIYFDTKEYPRVIEDLTNALKHDPKYANALEWRARAYLELKEGEKALVDAQSFHALYPDNEDAMFILARSLEATDRTEEALAMYNKLIPKAPQKPEYINNRGVIYFNKLRRYPEARSDFESCIRLDPSNGLYYINLSRCYYMMGDMALAKTNAQKAKELGVAIDPAYAGVIGLQ